MTDDEGDASEELGKTGEKMGGIADRFGASTDTTDTIETSETGNTTDTLAPGDEGFVLREDWNGRTIYLSDDDVDELDIRYSEVNVEWQREDGEQLPKNEKFYPEVIRAGLSGTSIEEELGLKD
ncbi:MULTISPECIES: hypothetical protein [Halorubrum]|uniref:DUF8160 domain-containing protein n=1 Tax=Halorubrum tropicale TaxID=1765655 RepID=A0A0M9ARF7_9EURY|nr:MULTISPECIES: hypothetical protein [Halorubrum]KOX97347.1 hypothetical protein AMR74_00060 [Halorubrum tropicale]TKX43881.1 hypothetical protein EXE50_08830 [Halorubrum sp. ARQ200]